MSVMFTAKSSNKKTGPIPTVVSQAKTCPDACPLKNNGCYANYGPLAIHWKRLNTEQVGISWEMLCENIAALPKGQLWRYNVAGDLPGENNNIDRRQLNKLVKANKGKRGFTYTHKPMTKKANREAVKKANQDGLTINLSANRIEDVDALLELGVGPVVTLLSSDAPDVNYTEKGVKVVTCPAQTRDDINCKKCEICANSKRDYVIGFLAHGTGTKKVDALVHAGR